jgi:fatty-acyl-CoA synthase
VRALADAMSRRGVSSGWGETPVAVVALRDGAAALDIGELRSWAAQFLARYKLPTDLSLVDALPRNASGKVVKDDVRRRVGQAPPG